MKLIVAVNNSWGIGKGNDLLYHIPTDMKFFRSKTKDNIIIIGRKTLESFPNSKPLPYRTNIVLTRDKSYVAEDTVICNNSAEIFDYIKNNQHIGKDARREHKQNVIAYKESLEELQRQKICPYCKSELALRNGKNGKFYGCKNFPKCRYTMSCEE